MELFRGTENGFKRALSLKCNSYTYSPGQVLAKNGEVYPNLYYIKSGLVQVIVNATKSIFMSNFGLDVSFNVKFFHFRCMEKVPMMGLSLYCLVHCLERYDL